MGKDISDDHPISETYDNTLDTAFYDINTVETAGLRFFGAGHDQLECGTCHNPHDNSYDPFLRLNNKGSSLCITCHIK